MSIINLSKFKLILTILIARNVFLLSLMIDFSESYAISNIEPQDSKLSTIWNLYYHFSISQNDLELVRKQSSKLLSFSESPEEWVKSPYNSIKFVSLQTMGTVRDIWMKYAVERSKSEQDRYNSTRRSEIKTTYNDRYGKKGMSYTFYAGPHWEDGLETMNKGLGEYWKSGVAGGLEDDIKALGSDRKGSINPLFAICSMSGKFVIHFTLDPIMGFHLAEVYDKPKGPNQDVKTMVALAKSQFRDWSKAFVDHMKAGSVVINWYYGDATTFCHELSARTGVPGSAIVTRLYTAQWSIKPLLFDGDGGTQLPKYFDVIDTSNLVDWVGMTNLLIPAAQILSKKSTSILYSESFRLSARETENDLSKALHMDVNLFSLMFGLAPIGYLLGYSLDNSFGEDITHLNNPNRYRMRISWKHVVDQHKCLEMGEGQQTSFDHEELVTIFFNIYLNMFSVENLDKFKGVKERPLNSQSLSRYTRLSYATLIKHAKRNIATDWIKFFPALRRKIRADETLHISKDCVADFWLQLSLCGALPHNVGGQIVPKEKFTYVTLVVPRKELKIFDKLGGAPGIHLTVSNRRGMDLFFAIQCFFGRVKQNALGEWSEVVEDPKSWAGKSDLIITTPVPSSLVEQGEWEVYLLVTIDIRTSIYMHHLGPEMCVFGSEGTDRKHVFRSTHPPGISASRLSEQTSSPDEAEPNTDLDQSVVISASQTRDGVMLQAKYSVEKDSEEAIALGKAAFVTLTDFTPCSILLNIGDKHSRRLIFPYPVDSAKLKTRIARKSLWIEVNVPVSSALSDGGYNLDPFPLLINKNTQPTSWALPYVNLPKLPVAKSSEPNNWIDTCLPQYLSKREQRITSKGTKLTDFRSVLPKLKETVYEMFQNVLATPPTKNFIVSSGEQSDPCVDTCIIVDRVRHGRETGVLYLDAWIYSISSAQKSELVDKMPREEGMCYVFECSDEEAVLWKQIMPAAVESCRSGWKHKEDCDYLKEMKAPITVEPWGKPICSCGEGKDVEGYPQEGFVAAFKEGATRIAVPLLSAPSFVEAMNPNGVA